MNGDKPRLLSSFEITAFLARHPLVAARVSATKAAILLGAYDFDIYTTSAEWGVITIKFPGVIEPRGIQVEDSVFKVVTIQPAPAGIFFSGFSPVIGDIDKPNFESPWEFELPSFDGLLMVALIGGLLLLRKR